MSMFEVLKAEINNLEKAIWEAERSGIPMTQDYEPNTQGYSYRRNIWNASRDIRFSAIYLDQKSLDIVLDLFQQTIALFGESYYSKCQRERMIFLIQVGLRLKLGVPDKYKSYIPEAILSMDQASSL